MAKGFAKKAFLLQGMHGKRPEKTQSSYFFFCRFNFQEAPFVHKDTEVPILLQSYCIPPPVLWELAY